MLGVQIPSQQVFGCPGCLWQGHHYPWSTWIILVKWEVFMKLMFERDATLCKKWRVIHFKIQSLTLPRLTSWWYQPDWKTCSSNWIISPGIGVNIKNVWKHHRVVVILTLLWRSYYAYNNIKNFRPLHADPPDSLQPPPKKKWQPPVNKGT